MNEFFGKRLKELRNEKELTQKQLAEILKTSKTTICQWETSKQEPDLNTLVRIADYFNICTDYLLGRKDYY